MGIKINISGGYLLNISGTNYHWQHPIKPHIRGVFCLWDDV
jgi:hypothetical protein